MRSVLDEDLYWRFSLAVYRQADVAHSCLALQARIGLDVNVLLMALLAARWHGRAIERREIERADAIVQAWREEVVVPLRNIRSRLKHGPAPAPDTRTDALRDGIKASELRAERIQQGTLAQWIDGLTPAPVDEVTASVDDCLATAACVVDVYRDQNLTIEGIDELRAWATTVAKACAGYRDVLLSSDRER